MNYEPNYFWPEVFSDTSLVETREPAGLCADGLCAWANCMMGQKPPESFGDALAAISSRLGCSATAEGLSEHAKKMGWLK